MGGNWHGLNGTKVNVSKLKHFSYVYYPCLGVIFTTTVLLALQWTKRQRVCKFC